MGFDWYHRPSLDPWHVSACAPHGAELVALGFCGGVSLLHAAKLIGVAEKCMLCDGLLSIAEMRACRCNTLGVTCPVHFDPRLAEVAMRRAWSDASYDLLGTLLGFDCRLDDNIKHLFALSQAFTDARAGVKVPSPPSGGAAAIEVAPLPPVPLGVLIKLFMRGVETLFSALTPARPTAANSAAPADAAAAERQHGGGDRRDGRGAARRRRSRRRLNSRTSGGGRAAEVAHEVSREQRGAGNRSVGPARGRAATSGRSSTSSRTRSATSSSAARVIAAAAEPKDEPRHPGGRAPTRAPGRRRAARPR